MGNMLEHCADARGLEVEPGVETSIHCRTSDIPALGAVCPRCLEKENAGQRKWRENTDFSTQPVCCESISQVEARCAISNVPDMHRGVLEDHRFEERNHELPGAIGFRNRADDGSVLVR